jgi:glycosyltransferase involved in cell wall biosynthesis
MSDRTPVAPFGRPRVIRHAIPGPWSGLKLFVAWLAALIWHVPALLSLRAQRPKNTQAEPSVLIFSDNLDETNGIAINSRQLVGVLRDKGRKVQLMGVAFHTKPSGFVERCGTILLPQVFSMQQVGYDESELAIPSLGELIAWLRRNPVDLVEIETPSTGGMLVALSLKMAGYRVFSHYRTDIFAYADILVSNVFVIWIIRFWVKRFNALTKPVIVPSSFFHEKLQRESGLKPEEVKYLERGIPLEKFSPEAAFGLWEKYLPLQDETRRVRFLYVGRVSQEKELDFLLEAWAQVREMGTAELLIVGQGPYLQEMKSKTEAWSEVGYAGKLLGQDLSAAYAESDFFLFPSGTDTFGNVVVESLASGTPALVSDMGGPRDIVDAWSGWVLPYRDLNSWVEQMKTCAQMPLHDGKKMHQYIEGALARSKQFEISVSAEIFWDFFVELHKERRL